MPCTAYMIHRGAIRLDSQGSWEKPITRLVGKQREKMGCGTPTNIPSTLLPTSLVLEKPKAECLGRESEEQILFVWS